MLSYIYIYICSIITTKTRFIIHIHSDWSLGKDVSLKEKIRNYIKYKIICGKTRFITVSPKFVQYNPKRIIYIPNCIVLDRINDSLETRNEFRRNNNISDDEILCEVFGWSPLIKGVDIAANAIKYLIDNNHKNIKLLIICGEKYNNDQLSQWLKNNSNCNGNENYILYKAPRTDVFTFHNSSDILISASRSEGFSYVLLEMLSLGKNCIVSNIEGTKWSSDFNNVIMFKSEDYKDCAQAILKSIDRGIHSDLEDVERTKNTYNISIWAEKIKKYYDNL